MSIGFLWWFEARNLAKVRLHGEFFVDGISGGIALRATFATNVPRERSLLHPAMNSGLFECFEGCCLSVCQSRLGFAFGKSPMPAIGSHQKKFDAACSYAIADGGDLSAFPKP